MISIKLTFFKYDFHHRIPQNTQIVIPKEFRNLLGIKSGTRFQAIRNSQGIRLLKEPEIDKIKGLIKGLPVDDAVIRE